DKGGFADITTGTIRVAGEGGIGTNGNIGTIDPQVEHGRDDFNREHVFVANVLYDLPFGKGKTYMGGTGRAADLLVGGWGMNWTLNWSSGLPWTPSYSQCGADKDTGPCRPTLKGSFNP